MTLSNTSQFTNVQRRFSLHKKLVVPALVLTVLMSGCSSLEPRTDAETAYLGYLNQYQLQAPAMIMVHDRWPLERSEDSYQRMINSLAPLVMPVLPDSLERNSGLEQNNSTDPKNSTGQKNSHSLLLSANEKLAFNWVKTLSADKQAGPSVTDSARIHYAMLVWLGYEQGKTLSLQQPLQQRSQKALSILDRIKKPNAFSYYLSGVIRFSQKPVSALKSLEQSAGLGYAPAQAMLARLYLGNDGVTRNDRRARAMLKQLVGNRYVSRQQKARAHAWLATMTFYGVGGPASDHTALQLMKKAAPEAELLYLQALMFDQGLGSKAGQMKSASLLSKAVDADSTSAANELALKYLDGKGVSTDARQARTLLEQAAANGSAVASYNLGLDSLYGHSSPANNIAATLWLERAAARGQVEADRTLAYLQLDELEDQLFGDIDTTNIRARLKQSALQGDPWSSYALGLLSLRGQGGETDVLSGYAWLNVAVALGYRPAAELRDASALQMTRPELDRAQVLSQSFFDLIEKSQGGMKP